MKFDLFLLASLPVTLATSLAYSPPAVEARAKETHHKNCVLPGNFQIKKFDAQASKNGTGPSSYKFIYVNAATNVTTTCNFHKGSRPERAGNTGYAYAPRYSCKNKNVSFAWTRNQSQLAVHQKICPGASGKPEYEATGSVSIPASCVSGHCQASKSASYTGVFSSLNPIKKNNADRKHNGDGAQPHAGHN